MYLPRPARVKASSGAAEYLTPAAEIGRIYSALFRAGNEQE
jgi:hypothetical protein